MRPLHQERTPLHSFGTTFSFSSKESNTSLHKLTPTFNNLGLKYEKQYNYFQSEEKMSIGKEVIIPLPRQLQAHIIALSRCSPKCLKMISKLKPREYRFHKGVSAHIIPSKNKRIIQISY